MYAVVTLCPPEKDHVANSHFKPKKLAKNISVDSEPGAKYLEDHHDGRDAVPGLVKTKSSTAESRSEFQMQSKFFIEFLEKLTF